MGQMKSVGPEEQGVSVSLKNVVDQEDRALKKVVYRRTEGIIESQTRFSGWDEDKFRPLEGREGSWKQEKIVRDIVNRRLRDRKTQGYMNK